MSVATGSAVLYSDLQSFYTTFNNFIDTYGGNITTLTVPTANKKVEATDINDLNTKVNEFKSETYLSTQPTWWVNSSVTLGDLIMSSDVTGILTTITNMSKVKCRNIATNNKGTNANCCDTNSTNARCCDTNSTNAKCCDTNSTNANCCNTNSTNARCCNTNSTNANCCNTNSTNANCCNTNSTNANCCNTNSTNGNCCNTNSTHGETCSNCGRGSWWLQPNAIASSRSWDSGWVYSLTPWRNSTCSKSNSNAGSEGWTASAGRWTRWNVWSCSVACANSNNSRGCARGNHSQGCGRGNHGQNCSRGNHGQNCSRGNHGQNCVRGNHGEGCVQGNHGQNCSRGNHGQNCSRGNHGEGCTRGNHGETCSNTKIIDITCPQATKSNN